MRDALRDFLIAVGAAAALFAAATSWFNGREIAAVREDLTREIAAVREDLTREIAAAREDLATVQGTLRTTSDTVIAHVNAPGLHASGNATTTDGR